MFADEGHIFCRGVPGEMGGGSVLTWRDGLKQERGSSSTETGWKPECTRNVFDVTVAPGCLLSSVKWAAR